MSVKRRRAFWAVGLIGVLAGTVAGGSWLYSRHLATQAHEVALQDGTRINYFGHAVANPVAAFPGHRAIHVDGDMLIRAPDGEPLILHTRLMVLTVTGASQLRVTADSHADGEQVEVLSGHVQAQKSYPSNYSDPEQLSQGEMVMINRTIDLMEKERTDLPALQTWTQQLLQQSLRLASR